MPAKGQFQTHCKHGHPLTPDNVYVATHADGRQFRQCRTCQRERDREIRASMTLKERAARRKSFPSTLKMKDYQRKYRFEKRYGITVDAAKEMLIEQDGLCAICYGTEPATHLDHDHRTGTVRGWLCPRCNLGLGHFDDDTERLEGALAYLKGE